MPEFKCPRCNATLREEDSWVSEAPPSYELFVKVYISCYCCSWRTSWFAANVIKAEEVELPA